MDSYIWLFFLALGVLALGHLATIARNLQSIASMMERVLAHEGIASDGVEPSETVRTLALSRKTYVAAIRAYRQQSGFGLREAKAVVDRLAQGSGR